MITWTLQLDGETEDTDTSSITVNASANVLFVGEYSDGTQPMNGHITEVRWVAGQSTPPA